MSIIDILSRPGIHEREIIGIFGSDAFYDGDPVFDHPCHCIGFFNRSGSNLLAEYLRGTPQFSGFHEQLNFSTVRNHSQRIGVHSFPDYIRALCQPAQSRGMIHGFKASVDQLMMLQRLGIHRMFAGGLRVIHITREDLVGLAVSYQIAHQTKQWTSQQDAEIATTEVNFDAQQISHLIQAAQTSQNGISAFCAIFGHQRLPVVYEQLVRDPQRVLDGIAEFCGRKAGDWTACRPTISRQSSGLNDAFRERYLSQVRAMLGPAPLAFT